MIQLMYIWYVLHHINCVLCLDIFHACYFCYVWPPAKVSAARVANRDLNKGIWSQSLVSHQTLLNDLYLRGLNWTDCFSTIKSSVRRNVRD